MRHKKMARSAVRSRGRILGREFTKLVETGIMPYNPDIYMSLIRSIYIWHSKFKGIH
ncbi:hypothetical protein XccvBFoX7_gp72c [Xanthomonas phage FoX7]|uniref:Uncharacterized protein n=2 Tax=Carpasinavirus XcP1 TaxID=2182344 RepID=A0A858NPC4_9CAUD|nr:hypothetical protein XccvBFoX6_gp72c [Xanthomonas phage FoX6]QJB22229.1 hypothetical protein XccvBFoX7_gp72c [Xanthomonas phage FoX7]